MGNVLFQVLGRELRVPGTEEVEGLYAAGGPPQSAGFLGSAGSLCADSPRKRRGSCGTGFVAETLQAGSFRS